MNLKSVARDIIPKYLEDWKTKQAPNNQLEQNLSWSNYFERRNRRFGQKRRRKYSIQQASANIPLNQWVRSRKRLLLVESQPKGTVAEIECWLNPPLHFQNLKQLMNHQLLKGMGLTASPFGACHKDRQMTAWKLSNWFFILAHCALSNYFIRPACASRTEQICPFNS